MSDAGNIRAPIPGEPPADPPDNVPPPRHGCLTALMVLAGIVFLLPGVCTLAVAGDFHSDPLFGMIAVIAFVFGIGGILLIRRALRRQRN
jgi:hypothetical protein